MSEEKDNQLWFSHDCNAKDDPKIILLIDELGLEGFGIFWVLIETLRAQKGYKLQLKAVDALARRYNTTSQKMRVVIESYDLFTIDGDQFFFSPSLLRRMQKWDEKRQLASESGKKGAQAKKEKLAAQEAALLGFSPQDSTKGGLSNPQAITEHNNVLDNNLINNNTTEQELDMFCESIIQNSKKEIVSRSAYKTKLKELFIQNNPEFLRDFEEWKQKISEGREKELLDKLRGCVFSNNVIKKTILQVEKLKKDGAFKILFEDFEFLYLGQEEFYKLVQNFNHQKSAS
ncbi:DUF4373 domain-containing protein [Sulfurospirillum halorespirans]|uniref:Lin1244/Lin1753-like N-terminal domain-containing protein n=1 Tax=Sulfurospirillum halorespirans DSM 13726 TaxID=1193502 RepID=A0A1D7TIF0_9BACT|nr:DUF4373 domain-containing protein [Sulfurospirillum halorespirans]AOO64789.1 hypothetical protein SHALO_1009 [Sulfurospirillum halorespirans DSM 13726]